MCRSSLATLCYGCLISFHGNCDQESLLPQFLHFYYFNNLNSKGTNKIFYIVEVYFEIDFFRPFSPSCNNVSNTSLGLL